MRQDSYRVAALQLDCSGTVHKVEERAISMIREAARRKAQIACLPEHWIPGRHPNIEDEVGLFAEVAREADISVVLGADFGMRSDRVTVESVVIGPKGVTGRQQKTHLFGREKRSAAAGNDYTVFDVGGLKVGIAICHDLVYPEVARILTLKGAEVIFAPAKIVAAGSEPWELYVKARALENRVPVVSPNCVDPPRFRGQSLVVGLSASEDGIVYPRPVTKAGPEPAVLLADLDLSGMKSFRRHRLEARRTETYADLVRLQPSL